MEAISKVKIAVVGQKTAAAVKERNIHPDFIPPNFVADSLVEHFPDRARLANSKILFPRVETGGREVLVKELTTQGATVVEVPAYESGCAKTIAPDIANALIRDQIDVITFASSKTVKCFYHLVQKLMQTIGHQGEDAERHESQVLLPSARVCLASIGPQTSVACQQYFGRVNVEAVQYTLEGLTEAIGQWATFKGSDCGVNDE